MKFKCAHTDTKKVSELLLIQNPKNANTHSKEQIERLAKIIDFQGQRSPIVISKRSGFITKGHGRLYAIDKLGWELAAVDFQEYNSEAEEYADIIADNEIARWAEFNTDKFLEDVKDIDLGDFELLGLKDLPDVLGNEKKEGLTDEDAVPEVAKNIHGVKLVDIYKLGNHRLMCGDSTSLDAVEKLMDGQKADMVFTDPPYEINAVSKSGVLSKNYKKDIMGDDNTKAAKDSFNLLIGMFPSANHIWWGANYYSSCLPDSECWIVWDKNNGMSDQTDCELAWANYRSVVRQVTMASEKINRVHPTQKPVNLFEQICDRFNDDSKSVLDLFGGSGSTLIACEKTNRKCFMMEIDPHYCSVIIERWQQFTGQKSELLNG